MAKQDAALDKHSPIAKQSFERNVLRNLRDKKWEQEYKASVRTSRGFMHERTRPEREKKQREEERRKQEEYERKVENTKIPQDHQTKAFLRREIRTQARLELTGKEIDEIEVSFA